MTTLWKFLGQRAARASLAVLSFLTAVAVSGCLPTMETPETRFYVLDALAQDTQPVTGARGASPIVVDLTSVAIPQYLRRPQIVTRVSANRLVLSEFDNWGGSLEKNILRCMASNLSILLDTSDIHVAARRLPTDVRARIEVEVIRYERGPDNRVTLEAQWRLLGGDRDRTPIASKVSTLQSEPLSGQDVASTVAAMSTLLGQLSQLVAEAVVAAPNDQS